MAVVPQFDGLTLFFFVEDVDKEGVEKPGVDVLLVRLEGEALGICVGFHQDAEEEDYSAADVGWEVFAQAATEVDSQAW